MKLGATKRERAQVELIRTVNWFCDVGKPESNIKILNSHGPKNRVNIRVDTSNACKVFTVMNNPLVYYWSITYQREHFYIIALILEFIY